MNVASPLDGATAALVAGLFVCQFQLLLSSWFQFEAGFFTFSNFFF